MIFLVRDVEDGRIGGCCDSQTLWIYELAICRSTRAKVSKEFIGFGIKHDYFVIVIAHEEQSLILIPHQSTSSWIIELAWSSSISLEEFHHTFPAEDVISGGSMAIVDHEDQERKESHRLQGLRQGRSHGGPEGGRLLQLPSQGPPGQRRMTGFVDDTAAPKYGHLSTWARCMGYAEPMERLVVSLTSSERAALDSLVELRSPTSSAEQRQAAMSEAQRVELLVDPGSFSEIGAFVTHRCDDFGMADRRYTVFLRRYENTVLAFDPACTHLGCRIKHSTEQNRYLCPCHGGVFDEDGKVVSGPPPKPLEQHPTKVEGGKIWVYKEV